MLSFVSLVQEVSPVAKLSASCERHDDVHDHEDDDDDDKLMIYDRVSDVVENGGCFASKILTHNRMH